MAKTLKTLKSAKQHNPDSVKWSSWEVEYEEFPGRYFISDPEYRLQVFIEKLLQERTVLPEEIEKLLDLQYELDYHNRCMEECD